MADFKPHPGDTETRAITELPVTHTVGPWGHARSFARAEHWIISPPHLGYRIAVVDGADEQALANARLIAASPDLLAALKAVTDCLESQRDYQLGNGYPEDYTAVAVAKDAIKKAEADLESAA